MKRFICAFLLIFLVTACRQPYQPAAVRANFNFLVIDGFINATPGDLTVINLSRTRNLADTSGLMPEHAAQVTIQAKNLGTSYLLLEQNAGVYANQLTLDNSDQYRLNITTANGSKYVSDFVPVKNSPPIDSITWKQDKDVTIYANTHDALNGSHYYKWDFVETYEYHAPFETGWGVENGNVFIIDSVTQKFKCWGTSPSTDIVLGTSINLSTDLIDHSKVATIPFGSNKIWVRYTTLISQYVLTQDAYAFWQTLQKNTQNVGSLFDPQPSQLKSNIHCLSNPQEPVLGYMSAGTVQRERIFINNNDLVNWKPLTPGLTYCATKSAPSNFPYYNYPDTSYILYYFSGGEMIVIPKACVDCRVNGGTTTKPTFW